MGWTLRIQKYARAIEKSLRIMFKQGLGERYVKPSWISPKRRVWWDLARSSGLEFAGAIYRHTTTIYVLFFYLTTINICIQHSRPNRSIVLDDESCENLLSFTRLRASTTRAWRFGLDLSIIADFQCHNGTFSVERNKAKFAASLGINTGEHLRYLRLNSWDHATDASLTKIARCIPWSWVLLKIAFCLAFFCFPL